MSFQLNEISMFNLVKNEQDELCIHFPTSQSDVTTRTVALVTSIHRMYNDKANKGWGYFQEGSDLGSWVNNALLEKIALFVDLTVSNAQRLVQELSKYPFADTGLLVFAHYQSLATDYLMVCIVPFVNGMRVDEQQIDIHPTNYIDVCKVTIAARIDLTALATGSAANRYVSYLKGRAGRGVSDFFFDFLGIEEGLDTKIENIKLKQAIEDFISSGDNDKEESYAVRKQAKEFAFDAANSGEDFVVKELSNEMAVINGSTFAEFVADNGYDLAESFPANKKTVKALVEFQGSGGGIKISFDRQLLSERVFYDTETDTLIIKGTPPNLRYQLTRGQQ
ncbi:nucleoid-associated protein YejK [Vibrio diazotrophicus]|uniref:Nucleoid-associated protein YejK n=1 Tax=Vibrio diazotrophicus TaxID=685 RepID=A0ABX4W9V3_VIBDI|nr:nucleoid-associated protein YejK [Vibrio diazotrophicus]PNH99575.1 nucleoid-associated protein YejK [Vibrio diazotrophicus]